MKDLFDEFGIESKPTTDLFDEYGIEGPTAAETNAGLSKQMLDIDDYKKVSRLYDERLAELKAERNEKSISNMIADFSSDENGDVEFQWYNPLSWVGSSVAQNRKYLDDQIKALEQNETLIKNSMTPERFQEIKDFGAVGIYESFKKNLKWENTPVVGGFVEGYKKSQISNLMDKIKNSEELTDAENTVVQEYINDQIEMGIRGTSFGGKVVDGVARMPSFMIEYGLAKGMLGKASSVIGKTAVGQKAASVVGSVASKVSNTGKIGTAAVKVTGATGKAAGRALFMPSLTYNNYNDMRLNDMYALGENGQILFNEDPQNKATMVLKAFGLSTLTALSEDSGEALTALAKKGASPIFNKLPVGVRNELVKLARTTDKYKDTPISQLFTKGGYSNLLAEIGEERLEAVLGAVTGLDPQGDTYFDSVGNALMPGWEQFMVEAGVVSVAGGARSGLNYLYKKGYSSEFLKGLTTKEQDTLVESEIKKELGNITGASFQKITEGMATLEQFIEEHEGTPEAEQAIQTKKDLEFVGDQFYKMFLNAGHSEAKARRESQILQGISLWGAEETGLNPVEFIKQRFPEVKQMKLKDFQEQFAQKKQRADLKNVNLFEAVLNPKMRDEIAKAEKAEKGLSLIQFIKQRGGLKDVDGDLKAMDAGKMQIGLINNKGGNELDDIALAAWENGYFPDKMERPDIDELKSAIRDELFGEKKYAFQQGKESVLKDIEELEAALDMLDIDYSNMSASELEAVYNEAVNEYNASNKVTFDEDEYIDDEDYIPFQDSEGENVVDVEKYYILPDNIKNQKLNILSFDNENIKTKEDVEKEIQRLIDTNNKEKTQDGKTISFVNVVYKKGNPSKRYKISSHIAYSSKKKQPNIRNNAVFNINDLIKNSVFVEEDTRKQDKRGYDKALRFYTAVRAGEDIYPVRIVALHKSDTDSFDFSGNVYDVIFENKKQGTTASLPNKLTIDAGLFPDTISISDLLKNVKSSENKLYRQSDKQYRGAYYKDIIYLFEKANASTFMHETAHWFKEELKKFGSEKSKQMLQKVDEWTDTEFSKRYELGVKEGRYVVKDKKGLVIYDQSFKNAEDAKEYAENEIFARGFEAYLREGKAPNKYLKQAFQSFARFLQRLYTTVKDLNVALNDDIRSVFDDILGGTDIDFYLKEPAKVTNKKRTSNEEVIPLNDNESWIEALNRHLFDTVAPLEKVSNLAGGLKDGQRPDLLARVYQYSKMMIEKNISDKTYYIDENGNEVNTGEGFVPIINDFAQTFSMIEPNRNKALDDFNDYLVAIRYTEDLDEIEGVKVTEDQKIQSIENIAKLQEKYGENYALFEDFANRIYSYQQRILYNLVDSGNLSEEKYNEIIKKHKHYVPFKRVFADTNISGGISGRPIFDEARTSKVIKKIKGSEKDVKNVFVSIEMNAANIIDLAYRNKVARSVAGLKTLLPEYVQPKNQLFEKAKAKVKGVEVETTIPSKQKPYGNVIEYYEDGKKKYVEVAKPIYEAMHQLNPIQAGWLENLLRVASMPAKLLRFGATSTPNFILRNFVKDQFTAFIQTDKGMKTTPINTLKALCHIIGKSDLYSQWQKSGGSGSGYYDWSETGSKKYFAELNNKDGRFVKALKWLGTLQFIQKPSQIIEESTRLGAFTAAKKAGLSDIAAAIKSREATVDFARGGDVSKLINRLVPFFNVGMQSANKLYRTAKTNPSAFAFHSLTTIAFPSIMITGYYLYGAPDEEREKWLQIPDYVRDNNWCFYIGDDLITFPKPFTVGYTGTIIEDFMIWGYKGNKPEMREWYDVMLGAAGSLSPIQTVGSLLTPVGQVVIEGMTNYNFFQGRSIYPVWMERLPAEERATKRNSQIGLAIGKALDVSPAVVDNTLFGITSTLGRQIIGGAENMLDQFKRWNGEKVPEDVIIKKDIPLLGAIFGRIPDGTRSKSYQEFSKRFKEVSEINAAHSSKSGSEKAEYRREHHEELSEYRRLKRASDKMKRIQKQIDRVYEDPNMTSEDKTQRVIELERQITREAYNANLRNK